MISENTAIAAKGKWRGILLQLGVPDEALSGKHGPCPCCGGKDRFRWDNKEGRGTYYCTHCGAGDGMDLAIKYTGRDFKTVAAEIDGMLGNIKYERAKPEMTDESQMQMLRDVWAATRPIETGDLVDKYLATRNLDELVYSKALRFSPALRDGEGGIRPCMVAMVGVYGEPKYSTMHRTFLRSDGLGKAEMQSPRKNMPGRLPDGACVALSEYTGGPLGIAEGIETAMSASNMFQMPVWAALNAGMLEKWTPPEGCTEVVIYGDNDVKFGGQKSAYSLAYKLATKGVGVTVEIPRKSGTDWADEYMLTGKR